MKYNTGKHYKRFLKKTLILVVIRLKYKFGSYTFVWRLKNTL